MFVEIWSETWMPRTDMKAEKMTRSISIQNILAIEHNDNYNVCTVVMLNGHKYSHHESAEVLVKRIEEMQK